MNTRKSAKQVPFANGHTQQTNSHLVKPDKADAKTDYSRWRLLDESGRQTWHYLTDDNKAKEWPQSIADKYHLGLPTVWLPPEKYFSKYFPHGTYSNLCRASLNCRLRRNRHSQLTTACPSSPIYSYPPGTGRVNMAVLSFSFQDSSLPGT
jgi:hypothetical protein